MKNGKYLASVAGAALLAGMCSASAQVLNIDLLTRQSTINWAPVENAGEILAGNLSGDASTAVISASGATSSVSFETVNASGSVLNLIGTAGQLTDNHGVVYNMGAIFVGDISGNGATAAVSASGATSSVSVATVDTATAFGGVNNVVGNAGQATSNFASLQNQGAILAGDISGNGATAAFSASGATSSVSVATVDTFTDYGGVNNVVGAVGQDTGNFGRVVFNLGGITAGDISGQGATAAASASGAASSVSVTTIDTRMGDVNNVVGTVGQDTDNYARVTNMSTIRAGDISGRGATAAVSASGAASSVSETTVSTAAGDVNNVVGTVGQNTSNFGRVSNVGAISAGDISGNGATAAFSASGATSSVSVTAVETVRGDGNVNTIVGGVGQITVNEIDFDGVSNAGGIKIYNITGDGALAANSASGATSSVAVTSVFTPFNSVSTTINAVHQYTVNTGLSGGSVINLGNIETYGDLSGDGTTAVTAASGATSSVSVTNINTGAVADTDIGFVGQYASNTGSITNYGNIVGWGTDLNGAGSTMSRSASGATASVSVSNVAGGDPHNAQSGSAVTTIDVVEQSAFNSGQVENNFGHIDLTTFDRGGELSGNGATAAAAASGATSSVSVSNISTWNGNRELSLPDATANVTIIDSVAQTTVNTGGVINSSLIAAGNLLGNGSIVASNASGATSSVSVSNVADISAPCTTVVASVTQNTENTGPVMNLGIITAGNLSGHGSTAAIGASGATSAVSVSNVSGL